MRVILPVGLLAVAFLLAAVARDLERRAELPYPLARTVGYREDLQRLVVWRAMAAADRVTGKGPVSVAFRSGETLGEVLESHRFTVADAQAVIAALSEHVDPRRLKPEDRYAVLADEEERPELFELTLADRGRVTIRRDGDRWRGAWRPFERTVAVHGVRGNLDGSLEASIARAGGESVLAYRMADVLQWDLDFNRDLRRGDRFEVLYEKVYLDGVYRSLGSVLALRYDNDGRRLEAYRFGSDGAYYDAEGRPLRKMFLRSPLRYSRVTSNFSHRRFHPVLKSYRPHYGVDYGAPTGTPVRATANGVVSFAGWDRGGGKTVKLRHANGYLSAYLHLSRFASGVRRGSRVRQGEVIGYVGSTGLATASHLDYRIQKNGRWINPLSLKSVPAEPVPEEALPDFLAWRDRLREGLLHDGPLAPMEVPSESRLAATRSTDWQQGEIGGR